MIEDTSFMHKWRLFTGCTYIPAQTILPVIQKGEVHHFLGQGYYRLSWWSSSYAEPISTAPHYAQLSGTVRTAEGLLTEVEVGLLYTFQPQQKHLESLGQVMRQEKNAQSEWLSNALGSQVRKSLQSVCGQYHEVELVDGRNISRIERKLRLDLRTELPPFLVLSKYDTAVTILRISPPAQIEAEREAARCSDIYANQLHHQRSDIASYVHEQKLAQNSGHLNMAFLKTTEGTSPSQPIIAPVNNLARHTNGHTQGYQKEVNG